LIGFEEKIFEDDFEDDLGWTVENIDVTAGEWERNDPVGTENQPEDDHSADGTKCFVTGFTGFVPTFDDVDGGPTRLISPTFDLAWGDSEISFYLYFSHTKTGTQQPLEIELSSDNGATWVKVADVEHTPEWTYHSFLINDYIAPSPEVKIRFSASDNPDDDIVEALVDDFQVRRLELDPTLWADGYSASVASAVVVGFTLDAGAENGNRPYLLLGSLSGTSPGFVLPDGAVLPLNWDVLTDVIMLCLGTPICKDFLGALDADGKAAAELNTFQPVDPVLIGSIAHFAYCLRGHQGFNFASNPIGVTFEP
jgi:hypothetical protein